MAHLTEQDWIDYISVINEFAEDAFQEAISWHRSRGGLDRYQEDNPTERFTQITLRGLVLYNVFRTWPIDRDSETGHLDNQNCVLILNNRVLQDLGYLNANGYFNFNSSADKFYISGIEYRAAGDTLAAQAKAIPTQNYPLLTCIILTRHEVAR